MRPVTLEWPILKVHPLRSIFPNPEAVFTILEAIAFKLNYCPSFPHFTLCLLLLLKCFFGLQIGDLLSIATAFG